MQDIYTQFRHWASRARAISPQGKTREQSLVHAFEVHGRAVGGKDNALSVAEEVVEDMEERILRLDGRHPLLDIIHDQDVDSLIEVDEIVGRIVPHRVGVLHLKEARGDIEHTLLRIELLGTHTDGIERWVFPQPDGP